MALIPKNELSREEKRAKQESAQQEALLREVDDAVRQSDAQAFLDRWGKPLLGLIILALVAFAGYLYWDSRQEAIQAGQDALDMIDEQMGVAQISDAVYDSLVALRATVTEDLRNRAVALPGLTTYTPQTTLPALVVAHRLYGDARRADEIVLRNNAPHPGALRGGIELEVLSE